MIIYFYFIYWFDFIRRSIEFELFFWVRNVDDGNVFESENCLIYDDIKFFSEGFF